VLVFYYLSMAALFSGYGLVENKHLLWTLFVLDNAFFAFTMALTTYVNRIAPPAEHTPTLSAGVAFNHIAAVIMPLTGGLLWQYAGYRWAFMTGIVAALVSAAVAMRVPGKEPVVEARQPAAVGAAAET
jgi:MFS family permease